MAAPWSEKNPSCVITWFTLALLDQSKRAFPGSNNVKMKNLAFWAGSAELRAVRAKSLAIQLRQTFTEIAGAKYEPGSNGRRAFQAIRDELLEDDGKRTMADLALVHDEHFRFLGE